MYRKQTRNVVCGLAVLATLFFVGHVHADIINVPADQPTIQAGIDAAINGDEVVVAPGTYVENINFNGKAITVRSTAPTDPEIALSTIIDGGGSGPVVRCENSEGSDTVLSGVVITNGNAIQSGGGMNCIASSPTVTYCTFSGNTAGNKGGGMNNDDSDPTVMSCTFSGNTSFQGGGMYNVSSHPTVTDCAFSTNSAQQGGGMYNLVSHPTVMSCTFSGNSALQGGGVYNVASNPTVTNGAFSGNSATNNGGGGMYSRNSSPTVTNCTFSENTANDVGGGMHIDDSSPTVTGCTFRENSAGFDGGGMYIGGIGIPTLIGCEFCFNTPNAISGLYTDGGGNDLENCDQLPTEGTCCLSSGCIIARETNCIAAGGVYWGDADEPGPTIVMREPFAPNDRPMTNGGGVSSTRLVWTSHVEFTDADFSIVDSLSQPVPFSVSGSGSAIMLISFGATLLNDDYIINVSDTVQSLGGVSIDGDGNGIAGGDAVFSLRHRLRHDSDDDRDVDLPDFAEFQTVFTGP